MNEDQLRRGRKLLLSKRELLPKDKKELKRLNKLLAKKIEANKHPSPPIKGDTSRYIQVKFSDTEYVLMDKVTMERIESRDSLFPNTPCINCDDN